MNDDPMDREVNDLHREGRRGKEQEERGEDREEDQLLKDRFRLSVISIAEAEAKKNGMEISELVVACVANMAYKLSEQLAKDLELFARHANRKSINMQDVILSAHRNDQLATLLTDFSQELTEKDPPSEKKRKRPSKKDGCDI